MECELPAGPCVWYCWAPVLMHGWWLLVLAWRQFGCVMGRAVDVAVGGQQPSHAWLLGTLQSLPYPRQFGFPGGGAKEVQAWAGGEGDVPVQCPLQLPPGQHLLGTVLSFLACMSKLPAAPGGSYFSLVASFAEKETSMSWEAWALRGCAGRHRSSCLSCGSAVGMWALSCGW